MALDFVHKSRFWFIGKGLFIPYFFKEDVFMNLLWALKQSVLSISIELLPPVPPPPHPPHLPIDDRNIQAVSCQAMLTTTGPHQLITCRNRILTDGPMHIDLTVLPRSK